MPVLRAAGIAWQHDGRRGRYVVPLPQFDNVLAALEAAGHAVEIVGGGLW